jgi:6-phosphogluconate dehydrogenase (decarboxylating)
MQIGMIGLGRMGANMVRRLVQGGHECVAYDPKPEAVKAVTGYGGRSSPHAPCGSWCPRRSSTR